MKVAFLRNLHFYIRIVHTAWFSAQAVPQKAVNVAANRAVVEGAPGHHVHMAINVLVAMLGVGFFEVEVLLDGHRLRLLQSHALFSSRGGIAHPLRRCLDYITLL